MTHPQFRKFQTDWGVYKWITQIQPPHFTHHLYNACDSVVQNSIINTNKDFLALPEVDALKVIEKIVFNVL